MVRLEIDGKRVEIREGKTILEAAKEIGLEIPHLCYMHFLHHIAQLAGQGQAALAFGRQYLDFQQLAAHAGPGQTGHDPNFFPGPQIRFQINARK